MKKAGFSELELLLVEYLNTAHSRGELEVSNMAAAGALGVNEAELKTAIATLNREGILDRFEDPSLLSLSGRGLKLARGQLQVLSPETDSIHLHYSEASGDFLVTFFSVCGDNWSEEVAKSNLLREEKERLTEIGSNFFSHPASLEILRRVWVKRGGDKK